MKEVRLELGWKAALSREFEKPYFAQLRDFVRDEYAQGVVYPPPQYIFRALDLTPFESVKVVILGQDPYHGPGQANGLCFSVDQGKTLPPSLKNIWKELEDDLGVFVPARKGDLSSWAAQGVLLLNATLTVRARTAGSHQGKGWEEFTDAAIRALSEQREKIVFILWGRYARAKGAHIDRTKHAVIESAHPSPFSAHDGFFGSKPFSRTNSYLTAWGKEPISWT
jgi:uracil-DNA glycosylase